MKNYWLNNKEEKKQQQMCSSISSSSSSCQSTTPELKSSLMKDNGLVAGTPLHFHPDQIVYIKIGDK